MSEGKSENLIPENIQKRTKSKFGLNSESRDQIGQNIEKALNGNLSDSQAEHYLNALDKFTDRLKNLEQSAFIDKMTGVYNKNAFEDFMSHFDQGRGDKVTLVMVDLNGLKDINDKEGHESGNEYLKRTTEHLKNSFRKNDKIFRLGGDEFIVVCDFVNPDNRDGFTSHLKSRFNYDFLSQNGLDFAYGVAHTDKDISISDAFNNADAAMYQNKRETKSAHPEKYSRQS